MTIQVLLCVLTQHLMRNSASWEGPSSVFYWSWHQNSHIWPSCLKAIDTQACACTHAHICAHIHACAHKTFAHRISKTAPLQAIQAWLPPCRRTVSCMRRFNCTSPTTSFPKSPQVCGVSWSAPGVKAAERRYPEICRGPSAPRTPQQAAGR